MKNVFEVKNLTFSYNKQKNNVLNGLNFDVEQGKIFGLLGYSGAGKSTTQKIMTRLLSNYGGEILYNGKNLKGYNNAFYEEIGVGFEMPVHFNKLTAYENMKYFSELYKTRADINELLEKVGLFQERNQRVGEYSKGMKVRLNFIRSLLNSPKMLFLDEITNGLDPINARNIKNMIKEYKNNGGTVFLTTHLMNDVEELCDNVAFISNGTISEIASPKELKQKYGKRTVNVEYLDDKNESCVKEFNMDNLGENSEFLRLLKNANLQTVHSGETTLDEIFIKVVGENDNLAILQNLDAKQAKKRSVKK